MLDVVSPLSSGRSATPMARATSAFPTGAFIDRAMSQSREAVQPVFARGSGGARSHGAAGPVTATDVASRNENRGNRPCRSRNRLKKGYAAWFINSANSLSPFGFPQDGAVSRCSLSGRFLYLRDRRGPGRPQCLEPALLRSDC